MWFDRSACLKYDNEQHRLEVKVPNRFVAEWIGRNFERELREAAQCELGNEVHLNVHIDEGLFAPENESSAPSPARGARPSHAGAGRDKSMSRLRHRLEEFIVGPSNELAYAAAHRLAENAINGAAHKPDASDRCDDGIGAEVNTLFVHGGCGLGKTHLLQGICDRVLKQHRRGRVRYTTAERFTNEFLTAMRSNDLGRFRRRVRQLDLLAVDDVHFFAGKQATQQEFLHCFDAIDLSGAHVVMASDSHPKLIRKLSEALISRCLRGMVVQVSHPDTPTRIRIVQALAKRRGMSLLVSVIEVLAARCQGSVREIEGTLSKLHALLRLANEHRGDDQTEDTIGHVLLNRLFEAELQEQPVRSVQFKTILDIVTRRLDVMRHEIMGKSRNRAVVQARSMSVYLARQMTSMSYPEIAAALDRSNHSTVITANKRVERDLGHQAMVQVFGQNEPIRLVDLVDRLKYEIWKC